MQDPLSMLSSFFESVVLSALFTTLDDTIKMPNDHIMDLSSYERKYAALPILPRLDFFV